MMFPPDRYVICKMETPMKFWCVKVHIGEWTEDASLALLYEDTIGVYVNPYKEERIISTNMLNHNAQMGVPRNGFIAK